MRFDYKARTKEGRIQTGTIEASSRKAALELLEKYGFYVTSLDYLPRKRILTKRFSFSRVTTKNIISFTRQFSVMLKSAISPVESLRALVLQTENPDFREKILKIGEVIEGGGTLSQAFSLYPKFFDPFFVNIVKAGEATGKVANSLDYLADHQEREYNLNRKIKGAMIYPAFVVAVFGLSFFLVSFYIVPRLTEILEGFGEKLPLITKIVIGLSNFIREGGWLIIFLLLAGLVLFFFQLKRFKKSKEFYNKIILKVPILGDFNKKIQLVRFSENLSVLIKAGLPITQALKIIEGIVGNIVYKKIIRECQERVSRGERISSVFSQYPEKIPPFVTQMVSAGEEAGRLEETLMNVVNFYRAEIERTTENLTSILEPILILILAGGVGVLAVSIFIPLFKIGMAGLAQ
ncbi:MAG: type II secretion system F family protein [Patescibacteria group bacterium]|nr:type II secretion system F family protein [Patescibacteria group bacterium]